MKPARKNTSIPYAKARLKPFTRPLFWGPIAIISLLAIALYQYWQNPYFLEGVSNEPVREDEVESTDNANEPTPLSADELAAGADIDNVDLLLQEIQPNQVAPANGGDRQNLTAPQIKKQNTEFDRFKEQQRARLLQPNTAPLAYPAIPNSMLGTKTEDLVKRSSLRDFNYLSSGNDRQNSYFGSSLSGEPVGRLYKKEREKLLNPNSDVETTNYLEESLKQSYPTNTTQIPSNSIPTNTAYPINSQTNQPIASPSTPESQPGNGLTGSTTNPIQTNTGYSSYLYNNSGQPTGEVAPTPTGTGTTAPVVPQSQSIYQSGGTGRTNYQVPSSGFPSGNTNVSPSTNNINSGQVNVDDSSWQSSDELNLEGNLR